MGDSGAGGVIVVWVGVRDNTVCVYLMAMQYNVYGINDMYNVSQVML